MEKSQESVPGSFSDADKGPTNPPIHGHGQPLRDARTVQDVLKSIQVRIEQYNAANVATGSADWLNIPELPTAYEIASIEDGRVIQRDLFLQKNKLEGPWESQAQYLEAQYHLMREDCVSPLRDAVEDVRNNPWRLEDSRESNAHIYERVYITGVTDATQGIAHRLEFSIGRATRRIAWASSKRLKSGTIVAITPADDYFRTVCLVAVVAGRSLAQLEAEIPAIDVYFSDLGNLEIDPQVEYLMVESSTGYFEAGRHTLKAMQHIASERFPLSEHLVYVDKDISPPEYLRAHPNVDLSSCFLAANQLGKPNILTDWPKCQYSNGSVREHVSDSSRESLATNMDESQFEALHRILTRRFAIVQGPPGTGKTYVSVVALKVLLDNRRPDDPPIIVASQTNHALDQLLRHIKPFAPNFIRIGGQTQDFENIEPRTLYKVKDGDIFFAKGPRNKIANSRKKGRSIQDELEELLEPLVSLEGFSPTLFLRHKLISVDQYRSLVDIDDDWIGDRGCRIDDPIVSWAGNSIQHFKRKAPRVVDNSRFDAEYDDLQDQKDAFLERGVIESDNKEAIYGKHYAFSQGYATHNTSLKLNKHAGELLGKHSNLYDIPEKVRGLVYCYLRGQVMLRIRDRVRKLANVSAGISKEVWIARQVLDATYLREAPVVGMTTTGLSKYRAVISSIRPKIVLIEEAAETQEAYVTAACLDSLEHLILVGDHRQLRAHCQSKGMEEFHLDISLFERMVDYNGMGFEQLKMQRRMLPEIRKVLNVIYPNLIDHPCVLGRERIPGMGGSQFWFMTHETGETIDEHFSWINEEEAHMVAHLFDYLVANGTDVSKITILTFYNGQRRKILSVLRKFDRFVSAGRINVCTVDSYQGEENEVIILSLVRNNSTHSIGFLSVVNRVCVALSRARRGFYIFGNARQLSEANQTWAHLIYKMSKAGSSDSKWRLGKHLPLVCKRHNQKVVIRSSMDWNGNSGGCSLPCHTRRACGHTCPLRCHPESHDKLPCLERCHKKLACGHHCKMLCRENPCHCQECESMSKQYNKVRFQSSNPREVGDNSYSDATRFHHPTGSVDVGNVRNANAGSNQHVQEMSNGLVRKDYRLPDDNRFKVQDERKRDVALKGYQDFALRGAQLSERSLASRLQSQQGANEVTPYRKRTDKPQSALVVPVPSSPELNYGGDFAQSEIARHQIQPGASQADLGKESLERPSVTSEVVGKKGSKTIRQDIWNNQGTESRDDNEIENTGERVKSEEQRTEASAEDSTLQPTKANEDKSEEAINLIDLEED